jgi:hypothetical protein
VREKYCWLVAGGWFVVREKYCWLVADKPHEQGVAFVRVALNSQLRPIAVDFFVNIVTFSSMLLFPRLVTFWVMWLWITLS